MLRDFVFVFGLGLSSNLGICGSTEPCYRHLNFPLEFLATHLWQPWAVATSMSGPHQHLVSDCSDLRLNSCHARHVVHLLLILCRDMHFLGQSLSCLSVGFGQAGTYSYP